MNQTLKSPSFAAERITLSIARATFTSAAVKLPTLIDSASVSSRIRLA